MKTIKIGIISVMAAMMFAATSCGNKTQNAKDNGSEAAESAMDIDSLLADAENLVNKDVEIEGVCTHTCKHGATKIFLMGSDNTKTIRVEAAELGSFDTKCINNIVNIRGILKEERIDEAYLTKWEEQTKAQTDEKHGDGEEGCSTEKNARGETANSTAERIADFRKKIAEREEKTGKAYLSFYFIEAKSYEIKE